MAQPQTIDMDTGEVIEGRALTVKPADALTEFGVAGTGIERARVIANELANIVREKKLAVRIGQGEHLRVEAWCACAAMVGVSPRTEWSREVRHPQTGDLEGYEARVEVVRMATGAVIGAAEAGCFFDEQQRGKARWTERHACKSMAQTRATSKALGQVLRWLPVLAGYSGTPAEEMPAEEPRDVTPVRSVRPAPEPPRAGRITDAQLQQLVEAAKDRAEEFEGVSAADIGGAVMAQMGVARAADLLAQHFDEALSLIAAWDVPK